MKKVLTVLLTFFTLNTFSQTERVWEKVENAPVITVQNAPTYTSYENTLESVVNYFYASQIRKDEKWKEVFLPEAEWSERIQYKLGKYEEWTITNFHLVSKTAYATGKFYVKVYFKIEMNGRSEDAIDTAEVQFINGSWVITSVPT